MRQLEFMSAASGASVRRVCIVCQSHERRAQQGAERIWIRGECSLRLRFRHWAIFGTSGALCNAGTMRFVNDRDPIRRSAGSMRVLAIA